MTPLLLIILSLKVLVLELEVISSLPVTSKPIENTPEHLAWEAWIMVPPTHDKTRKIKPKSIFILPNKTNGGSGGVGSSPPAVQCPPGHQIDNLKCIPEISINHEQIRNTYFQNLIHSTDKYNPNGNNNNEPNADGGNNFNYDYDYDYGEAYDPNNAQSYSNTGNMGNSNNNGEPLKINLAIGKLPNTRDDSKETSNNYGSVSEESDEGEVFNMPPFRGEESSSTTAKSTTTFPNNERTAITTELNDRITTTTSKTSTTIKSSTTIGTIYPDPELSSFTTIPTIDFTNFTTNSSTSTVSVFLLGGNPSISTEPTLTTTEQPLELEELTTNIPTSTEANNEEIELVTEIDENKSNLNEDLIGESFVLENDKVESENATEIPENFTESIEHNISTTVFMEREEGEQTKSSVSEETVMPEDTSSSSHIYEIVENFSDSSNITLNPSTSNQNRVLLTEKPFISLNISEIETLHDKLLHIDDDSDSKKKLRESIEQEEDAGPVLEHIESNNRFVYHHLGAPPSNTFTQMETTTPDYIEQLRIINRIVEENKRRSQQQGDRIRFPTADSRERSSEVRNDFVRFPESSVVHTEQRRTQHDDRFLTGQLVAEKKSLTTSNVTPTEAISYQRNTKPFWWLPTGWEIDQNGQKPLLVRFWSRMPENRNNQEPSTVQWRSSAASHSLSSPLSSSSSTTTTSGYRENSRSPTENLYKEISSQDIYKVMGAKNWMHNNR